MLEDQALYECADCGLHYKDPQKADECYQFCTTYHACNLEITRQSVERRHQSRANESD